MLRWFISTTYAKTRKDLAKSCGAEARLTVIYIY